MYLHCSFSPVEWLNSPNYILYFLKICLSSTLIQFTFRVLELTWIIFNDITFVQIALCYWHLTWYLIKKLYGKYDLKNNKKFNIIRYLHLIWKVIYGVLLCFLKIEHYFIHIYSFGCAIDIWQVLNIHTYPKK